MLIENIPKKNWNSFIYFIKYFYVYITTKYVWKKVQKSGVQLFIQDCFLLLIWIEFFFLSFLNRIVVTAQKISIINNNFLKLRKIREEWNIRNEIKKNYLFIRLHCLMTENINKSNQSFFFIIISLNLIFFSLLFNKTFVKLTVA